MTKPGLAGMTTNERLFELGLLDAFDDALARKDRAAMVAMLEKADFGRDGAEDIADVLLVRSHPVPWRSSK